MSGAASTGNSLLRVSQACETLLAGFNSGRAAAVRSCLVSRKHAVSVVQATERHTGTAAVGGEHHNNNNNNTGDLVAGLSQRRPNDALLPLETAMANRRARPSLLLPAWRAVGFAVGTGATALLPSEASAMVGDAIGRAVTEQYDANIRTMYDAGIVEEESEVKDLFKAQRDEPSRAALTPDAGGGDDDGGLDSSGEDANNADAAAEKADDARSVAVAGTLKSALRMACTVTAKI